MTRLDGLLVARRGAWGLAALVLANLGFRLYLSHKCSVWLDEAATHSDALKSWSKVMAGPKTVQLPLMYVLVKLTIGVLGQTTFGLRAVSLLFGCLLLIAVHHLCLELGLSVRRSLLVAATFGFSPFFIRHAIEARFYALLMTFAAVAMLFGLRLLKDSTKVRDLVWFGVATILTASVHYFGLAFALVLLGSIALKTAMNWRGSATEFRAGTVAVLLATLIPLGLVARRARDIGSVKQEMAMSPSFAFDSELGDRIRLEFSFLSNDHWALFVQPVLAVSGLVLLTRRLPGLAKLWPLGLGVVPGVAACFVQAQHFVAPRYIAPSAILIHVGTAVALFAIVEWLQQLLGKRNLSPSYVAVPGLLMLGSLVGVRASEYPRGYSAGTNDYRSFQRYYVKRFASRMRLITYPGDFGNLIFNREYPVGERAIPLERFQAVPGIRDYVLVQLHTSSPESVQRLQQVVQEKLGIPGDQFAKTPLLKVPFTAHQEPTQARLVRLPNGFEPPPPEPRRKRRKRTQGR